MVVFLFIDDLGLTLMYVILCLYIRFHAKRFRAATTNGAQGSRSHELQDQRSMESSNPAEIDKSPQGTLAIEQAGATPTHQRMNKVAYTLLLYPVLYIFHTMPLAVLRLAKFVGTSSSYGSVYFGASIYCCSGWTTVLLYTATRKGIITWNWVPRLKRSREHNGSCRDNA